MSDHVLTTPRPLQIAPPILLVEDDAGQALLVQRVLRKARLANPLIVIANGDDAVNLLADQVATRHGDGPRPVLILLDLHIAGRSGLDVLAWIRAQPEMGGVPVVMLSGSTESEDIDRAFDLGAASYLVKPVAFDALVDAVSSLGLNWVLLPTGDDVPRS